MATKKKPAKKTAKKTAAKKKPKKETWQATPTWTLQGEGQAVGLHVDDNEVWAGFDNGDVVACDHDGTVLRRWKLPEGCCALVADDAWRYAGCNDGNVYDLTGRAPRVAYVVDADVRVLATDVFRGRLIAGDSDGGLSAFDVEQSPLFRHAPRGRSDTWMARADSDGVTLGNDAGIDRVSWSGERLWHVDSACVGYGVADGADVVVYVGDHESAELLRIRTASGTVVSRSSCFSRAAHYDRAHNAASCAAGVDVDYAATCNTLFAFDRNGEKQLEIATTSIGTPCSMAYRSGKLFVATHTGVLARLDVDELRALAPPPTRRAKLSSIDVSARDVEEGDADGGVVVEVVSVGAKLKVRVASPGHRADWYCQFPRDLRDEGARFVVDGVREGDGFYRVFGDIKRLR